MATANVVLPIPHMTNEWRTTTYYGNGLKATITNVPPTASKIKLYPVRMWANFGNYEIYIDFNVNLKVTFYDSSNNVLGEQFQNNVTDESPAIFDIPENTSKIVVEITALGIWVENANDPSHNYNIGEDQYSTDIIEGDLLVIDFLDSNGQVISGTSCNIHPNVLVTPKFADDVQVSGTSPSVEIEICNNTAQYIDTVLLEIVPQNAEAGDQLTASFQYYDGTNWVEESSQTWSLADISGSTWFMYTWNNYDKPKKIVFTLQATGTPTVNITVHSGKKH